MQGFKKSDFVFFTHLFYFIFKLVSQTFFYVFYLSFKNDFKNLFQKRYVKTRLKKFETVKNSFLKTKNIFIYLNLYFLFFFSWENDEKMVKIK